MYAKVINLSHQLSPVLLLQLKDEKLEWFIRHVIKTISRFFRTWQLYTSFQYSISGQGALMHGDLTTPGTSGEN